MTLALIIVFVAIIILVTIANRINVAYPIVLVVGGMLIGYIPHVPTFELPPEAVLLVFLPPLLYWESVTAPTSEFRAGALWIFQMAFGLVIVTTVIVAAVAHAVVPGMSWGVAFVLGAILSATDEVAFAAISERLTVPRHVIGTIEGESLVNDATALILYGIGVAAVVGSSFSFLHAAGLLVSSVAISVVTGLIVAAIAVAAWKLLKNDYLQATVSVLVPFLSYLPAYHFGASGVLATVTAGLTVNRFTPTVLLPSTRETLVGFWVTAVFLLNAFIFVEVGVRFHQIVLSLRDYSPGQLVLWGAAVALTCIAVRIIWTFAQGLLPITNEPEHVEGKADWPHVAVLAWTGMRGGVSLAAALAIPLETHAGPFPDRNLLIFLTFCVLLATLVVQGSTLPFLIKWLGVKDDGAAMNEERLALAASARAALHRLEELVRQGTIPPELARLHRARLTARVRRTSLYRQTELAMIAVERAKLDELRKAGKIDNTVLRRLMRVLDLETLELQMLESVGHSDLEET